MSEQELLDLLANAGIEGVGVVQFLGVVNHWEAKLIRYLIALGGSDDARASLSEAQAQNSDATGDGFDEIAATAAA